MANSGPPDRAVALARRWLTVMGCLWLATGFAFLILEAAPAAYWGAGMVVVGFVHFIVARYAGRRFAVFFALFGP